MTIMNIQLRHSSISLSLLFIKRWLEKLYNEDILELNHKSCEMISDDLYQEIAARYPGRFVEIEVAEDGENGSLIFYPNTNEGN